MMTETIGGMDGWCNERLLAISLQKRLVATPDGKHPGIVVRQHRDETCFVLTPPEQPAASAGAGLGLEEAGPAPRPRRLDPPAGPGLHSARMSPGCGKVAG